MNNGEFNIIINSMINYVFCTQSYELSDEQLKHLCKVLDYPSIDDRYLTDNPNLYKYIQWDRLEKMQAVRVAARNKKLLDVIDLKKQYSELRKKEKDPNKSGLQGLTKDDLKLLKKLNLAKTFAKLRKKKK